VFGRYAFGEKLKQNRRIPCGLGQIKLKNSECTIYITTKRGYVQKYRKEESGWTQTIPSGKVRLLSAEQLLSHILPALAGVGPLSVRVEPDKRKKEGVE
jgi:hypothetical protein